MACNCKKYSVDIRNDIRPDEQCIFCAEKHFATALCLMREIGYEAANAATAKKEKILAAYHLDRFDPDFAASVRTAGDLEPLIFDMQKICRKDFDGEYSLFLLLIGELVLAGWHTATENRDLAKILRQIRHSIQTNTGPDMSDMINSAIGVYNIKTQDESKAKDRK